MMTIVETGHITTQRDLLKLDIIDWQRAQGYWDNTQEAVDTLMSWLVASETSYTIITCNLQEAPERNDWPGWTHVGNHVPLGKLYWNWFHWKQRGSLTFSDAPDFHGRLRYPDTPERRFYGDIGHVSPSAFSHTFRVLAENDLWISVIDEYTQIILEPSLSVLQICAETWTAMLGHPQDPPVAKPSIIQRSLF
jgi:hypothetical protein